ncbi:MAG: hypothetical protein KJ645_13130, partial [Planctomycetes bacterium]|nr:hypothetical protein [Planctomycetota bacterium]
MPFCPKCRQEYEQGFIECADCLVPLQSEISEAPGSGDLSEDQAVMAAVFRAESEEVLDLMLRAVALHHVPTQVMDTLPGFESKGHFMVVPQAMESRVNRVLELGLPMLISEGEGKDRIFRFYQAGEDYEIRDPELLHQSTSSLVAQGAAVLDELIEIVARGDQAARHRAAYVLTCMGDEGVLALTKLLKVAIEKAQSETAISLIKVMRDELEPGQGWEELCAYLTASSESKILTLQALASLATIEAFPRVLPLMSDPDSDVRDEADNTLCTLTDEDMGFDTHAPETDRRAVIEEWEAWWAGRK